MFSSEWTWAHTYLTLYQMCKPHYRRKIFVTFPLLGYCNIQNRKITHTKWEWYFVTHLHIRLTSRSRLFHQQDCQNWMMEDSSWIWRIAHCLMCPHFPDSSCQLRCLIMYHWCLAWTQSNLSCKYIYAVKASMTVTGQFFRKPACQANFTESWLEVPFQISWKSEKQISHR